MTQAYKIGEDRFLVRDFSRACPHLEFVIEFVDNKPRVAGKNHPNKFWNRDAIAALQQAMLAGNVLCFNTNPIPDFARIFRREHREVDFSDLHQQISGWLFSMRKQGAAGVQHAPDEYLAYLAICIEQHLRSGYAMRAAGTRNARALRAKQPHQGILDLD